MKYLEVLTVIYFSFRTQRSLTLAAGAVMELVIFCGIQPQKNAGGMEVPGHEVAKLPALVMHGRISPLVEHQSMALQPAFLL